MFILSLEGAAKRLGMLWKAPKTPVGIISQVNRFTGNT